MTVADWYREPAGAGRQHVNVDLTVTALNSGGQTLDPTDFDAKIGGVDQLDGSFCYHVLAGAAILGQGDRVRLLLTGTLDDGAPIEIALGGYGSPDPALVTLTS